MQNTELISELYRKIDELQQELREAKAELEAWYENGVLLTPAEKQVFYSMYQEEQRKKRREADEKARIELDKITTRVMTLNRRDKHAEDV